MARCLRACLALLLFLVSFADGREREEYVQLAWSTTLKILVCLILCSVADVAKTLLAKLLSSHFHKRAHFDKMQDALNKVSACFGFHWLSHTGSYNAAHWRTPSVLHYCAYST